jgi:hypothetical protein
MKTLFTTDIVGAQDFLNAVGFKKGSWILPQFQKDFIVPRDTFQFGLKEEQSPTTQVLVVIGYLGKKSFIDKLIKKLSCEQLGSKEISPLSEMLDFKTPFGFTFHVVVIYT